MQKGNCYEANGKYILDLLISGRKDIRKWKLCHGIVVGKGIEHGHCWIEYNDDMVMDFSNGHSIALRKEHYYALGRVTKVKRYTAKQVQKNILKYENWGEWKNGKM